MEKNENATPPGDDVSTAEAAPGGVGRGEQGEARRANSTPNGGTHLELASSCKNDFSIAHITPHSSSSICFYTCKKLKNVSCEHDRWVIETQLCKLRDTSDTLIGRAYAIVHLYGVCVCTNR